MDDLALIRREHVLAAVGELGPLAYDASDPDPDPDLEQSGYRLLREQASYDVVSVVESARRMASGPPIVGDAEPAPLECALLVRGLGFDVDADVTPPLPPLRFTNAATVGAEHARATWALAAHERLVEVAGTYGDSITVQDLAQFVQRRSLVRTTASASSWIGDVLGRVAEECANRAEPLLTALVVDSRGRVGASYATALGLLRGIEPSDVDEHAAQERLDCHRHAGAVLPDDGGGPVRLLVRASPTIGASEPRPASRARGDSLSTRRAAGSAPKRSTPGTRRTVEESVAASAHTAATTCPVHFTVVPPSGICDYCD